MRYTRDIAARDRVVSIIIKRHLAQIRRQLEHGPFMAAFEAGIHDVVIA